MNDGGYKLGFAAVIVLCLYDSHVFNAVYQCEFLYI